MTIDYEDELDRKKIRKEKLRFQMNWVFLLLILLVDGVNYASMTSIFHQYVINPRSEDLDNQSKVLPGLGESEAYYSWQFVAYNVGAFSAAIVFALSERLMVPYWYLLLGNLLTHIIGFLIRAISYQPGLIVLSSFLAGFFPGGHYAITFTYIAKSVVEYEKLLKMESGDKAIGRGTLIRNQLFSLYVVICNLGSVFGNVAMLIFARFPSINLFDAVSWFCVASGMLAIVLQILLFHEKMTMSCLELKESCTCRGKIKPVGAFKGLFSSHKLILIISSLLFFRGVSAIPFGLYEVIFNPVLSDTFGCSEEITPYFFIGLGILPTVGGLILIILQRLKMENRTLAFIGVIGSIIGASLIADWQAIPYDPCTEKSPFHHPDIVDTYNISSFEFADHDYSAFSNEMVQKLSVTKREVIVLTNQQTLIALEGCENVTYKGHPCHWIPKSSLFKWHYCTDCQPICRSPLRSLNIIQFCLGFVIIFCFMYPMCVTASTALLSDNTSTHMQGPVMSLNLVVIAFSRAITPSWGDAAYELVKKRTYLAMSIIIGLYSIVLVTIFFIRIKKNDEDFDEDDDDDEQTKMLTN